MKKAIIVCVAPAALRRRHSGKSRRSRSVRSSRSRSIRWQRLTRFRTSPLMPPSHAGHFRFRHTSATP
ncbi:MAG: hypothetical protein MZV64_29700 [Ignavibacteriales bacterium]|nr:hypothetical protein [Ignavibacteriales bacterium]